MTRAHTVHEVTINGVVWEVDYTEGQLDGRRPHDPPKAEVGALLVIENRSEFFHWLSESIYLDQTIRWDVLVRAIKTDVLRELMRDEVEKEALR